MKKSTSLAREVQAAEVRRRHSDVYICVDTYVAMLRHGTAFQRRKAKRELQGTLELFLDALER